VSPPVPVARQVSGHVRDSVLAAKVEACACAVVDSEAHAGVAGEAITTTWPPEPRSIWSDTMHTSVRSKLMCTGICVHERAIRCAIPVHISTAVLHVVGISGAKVRLARARPSAHERPVRRKQRPSAAAAPGLRTHLLDLPVGPPNLSRR